jgi:hypothetical protein
MKKRCLMRVIESALILKMEHEGDVPGVIDCLLEDVDKTLRCDPRLSRLSCEEFDVLFAAFADGARRLLGEHLRIAWECVAQDIDWGYAARMVTDAVIDELSEGSDSNDGDAS